MGAKERSNVMLGAAYLSERGPRVQALPAQIKLMVLILFLYYLLSMSCTEEEHQDIRKGDFTCQPKDCFHLNGKAK